MWREWALFGLAFLAVVQAAVLTRASGRGPERVDRWFGTGDTLAFLHAPDSPDFPTPGDREKSTILLVFHSECGHCLEVAPLWRDWTRTSTFDVRMVALSSEAQEVAQAFVSGHGWNTAVWTVDASVSGGPNHTLTGRTPWVFVLDPEGVVLAEGHGKDIAEITALLKSEQRSTP